MDGNRRTLGFDNMLNRAVTGTTDWKQFEVVLDVPTEAVNIVIGAFLSGKGQMWADDLKEFLRLKNMRMFGTFGEFRGFCKDFEPSDNEGAMVSELDGLSRNLTEGCACPQCNEPLFDLRMSKNELPQFYGQIESFPPASSFLPTVYPMPKTLQNLTFGKVRRWRFAVVCSRLAGGLSVGLCFGYSAAAVRN